MRYLLITYYKRPDGKVDEAMTVSKRLKDNDIRTANIILDFKLRSLDKCLVDGKRIETNWDAVYMYYKDIYPATIDRLSNENGWSGEIYSPTESDAVIDTDVIRVQ
jgi:hypothetical protein